MSLERHALLLLLLSHSLDGLIPLLIPATRLLQHVSVPGHAAHSAQPHHHPTQQLTLVECHLSIVSDRDVERVRVVQHIRQQEADGGRVEG